MGNYIRQWIPGSCALICKPPTIPSSPVLSFHLYSSSWENTFLFCVAHKSTFLGVIIGIYIYQHKKESNESETYKVCFVWQGYDMMIKHEIQCLLISVKLLISLIMNMAHGIPSSENLKENAQLKFPHRFSSAWWLSPQCTVSTKHPQLYLKST